MGRVRGRFSRGVAFAALIGGVVAVTGPACAQAQTGAADYPNRPVRLVVSFPPGGSADVVARSLQPHLEKSLGQPVIIDNRPGAGGVIGVDAVAKAAPDGYVIGLGATGALAVNVILNEKMPYDPVKDLAPIGLLAEIPFLLLASPQAGAKSVTELVALAKANPSAVSIGHGGNGTSMHLTAQLFSHMAGVPMAMVPYKGSGPVAADVMAGHVPYGVADIPSSLQLIRAGQIKALAVSTTRRVPSLPDVPTFAEAGIGGFESVGWFGFVAPAGTPQPVLVKLNAAVNAALREPAIEERIRNVGAEPAPGTAEQFGGFIRSEIDKLKRVIEASGAKAN